MGGSAGTLYPGRPDTMYPHCPGQTGYIVQGTPDTMRGVLVLIAPTGYYFTYLEMEPLFAIILTHAQSVLSDTERTSGTADPLEEKHK